ncbi:hypothetical protein ES702_05319 [subsurface metagenome]
MKCRTCEKLISVQNIKINNDNEGLFIWVYCPHCKEEHLAAVGRENFMTKTIWDDPSQWEQATPDQELEDPDIDNH